MSKKDIMKKSFKEENISKHFLKYFIPMFTIITIVVFGYFFIDYGREKYAIQNTEKYDMQLKKQSLEGNFKQVVSDLMYLSEKEILMKNLDNSTEEEKNILQEEFKVFAKRKGLYDQIRFVDTSGMEIVRVNYNKGTPQAVDKSELQLKADRYYVLEALPLQKGEVYVSPFDLNKEHGEIEKPIKPMIRFCTPVFDKDGEKRGIIILNYLGEKLLDDFNKDSGAFGEVLLLNAEGFYLKGLKEEDQWGFMYKNDRSFGNDFSEAWKIVSKEEEGQFYSDNELFTFTTIYPKIEAFKVSTETGELKNTNSQQNKKQNWKILLYTSKKVLSGIRNDLLKTAIVIYLILIIASLGISWLFCKMYLQRKKAEKSLKDSKDITLILIKDLSAISSEVMQFAKELSNDTFDIKNSNGVIVNSVHEIANRSEENIERTESSVTTIEEMSKGIQQIAETSLNVTELAIDSNEKANEGNRAIDNTINQMNSISKSVENAASKVKLLDENSKKIGEIVKLIEAISSQTNLLALNAAIESARAGEHGKGFSVVADEVRQLAERSTQSAALISNLISETQREIELAVDTMDVVTKEVIEGIGIADDARNSFSQILVRINDVAGKVEEVSAATQEASAGTHEILASIQHISHIAKDNADITENVVEDSKKQLNSMENVSNMAYCLEQMSQKLQNIVTKVEDEAEKLTRKL
ncbi:MAG: methyl-accepting chemotaxis protein [Marinisporobacter sp.]|jgi:methyl-accepting chemotaxis protein|nr:methyl-accepting chemotaxis protein [Marinisporobacter sp.]